MFSSFDNFDPWVGSKGQTFYSKTVMLHIIGEPKWLIVQKHIFFALERYTAGILNTDSLNSA